MHKPPYLSISSYFYTYSYCFILRCSIPGPRAPRGLPGTEVVGEGTRVMPWRGRPWLATEAAAGAGLLGVMEGSEVAAALPAGVEAAAEVAGMSYFCSWSR